MQVQIFLHQAKKTLHRVQVVEKKGDKILTLYVLKYWRYSSSNLTLSIVLTNYFTTFYSCNFIPR